VMGLFMHDFVDGRDYNIVQYHLFQLSRHFVTVYHKSIFNKRLCIEHERHSFSAEALYCSPVCFQTFTCAICTRDHAWWKQVIQRVIFVRHNSFKQSAVGLVELFCDACGVFSAVTKPLALLNEGE